MTKLIALPLLADEDVDGNETTAVVVGGITRRAKLSALMAPYYALIESARDAALAAANPQPDEATGIANTPDQQVFSWFDAAAGVIKLARNNGGVAEELAIYFGAGKIVAATGSTVEQHIRGFATRADIKGLVAFPGARAVLAEEGCGGTFVFHAGDYSTHIAADTREAIHLASDADPTGISGAWVREFARSAVFFDWFRPAGDGMTDDTAVWNAAIATLRVIGLKVLDLPAKAFLLDGAKCCDNLTLNGAGWTDYETAATRSLRTGVTRFVRKPKALRALDLAGARNLILRSLDVDGNGGKAEGGATSYASTALGLAATSNGQFFKVGTTYYRNDSGVATNLGPSLGDCIGDSRARLDGTTASAYGVKLENVKCYDGNIGFSGDAANPIFAVTATLVVFRDCHGGLAYVVDSSFNQYTLSSNEAWGAYITTGNLRFVNGFVEWNRGTANAAACGFLIDDNAAEVLIALTQFDRNSGPDVQFAGCRGLKLIGNVFKRCGWAPEKAKTARYAIFNNSASATQTAITGNSFLFADGGVSTRGVWSPLQACSIVANDVMWHDNKLNGIGDAIDLSNLARRAWFPSAVAGEYYLAWSDGTTVYFDQPDALEIVDGTILTAGGTAGSLAAGAWGWGDNDSLGFSTVYIRLPASSDPRTGPQSVYAGYNLEAVSLTGTNIQTDQFRDRWKSNGFTTNQTFTLKTREKNYNANDPARAITLRLFGRRGTSYFDVEVPVFMRRATTGAVGVTFGTFKTNIGAVTVGTNATDLIVSASALKLGGELKATVTIGTAGTYSLEARLEW